jgi:hypothetical protein
LSKIIEIEYWIAQSFVYSAVDVVSTTEITMYINFPFIAKNKYRTKDLQQS